MPPTKAGAVMTNNELIAAQDSQRTQRNFIALLGGVFGDHSMANEDGYAVNAPGGYQSIGTTYGGGVGIEGQPQSNLQNGGLVISFPFLLLCGVAFLVLKKG